MTSLPKLCSEIIATTKAESGPAAGCYQVGRATFRLHETQPVLAQDVAKHFPSEKPDAETVDIYLRYDGVFMDCVETALDGRWFQQIETLFTDHGMFGYHNAETSQFEFFDPRLRTAVRILPSPDHMPIWENSSPLSVLASWINQARGAFLLHSGLLEVEGNGAMLCGPSGSGKSLLTLAGVRAGMQTVGDDYIIVERHPDTQNYQAYPFSSKAKQSPAGLAFLSPDDPLIDSQPLNWQGKVVFPLGVTYAGPLSVNYILAPFIGQAPRITPANARDTARKLAESTIYQLPGSPRQTLRFASQLARDLPVFDFEMGPDVAQNVQALRRFLTDLKL
ncbi:MAG: hypothetical protein AAFN63_08485 [Pseudomonadota bacterium]